MNNELVLAVQTVSDTKRDFRSRLAAIDAIARVPGAESTSALHQLLERPRPGPETVSLNFDPVALERVVDMRIIRGLHLLGDDSELGRIPKLVLEATGELKGLEDEYVNAAQVISAIGRVEPIRDLSHLAVSADAKAVSNAVRVLDLLHLPEPAVCEAVPDVPSLQQPVEFRFQTLRQELETMEKLSQGHILLSPGVKEFLVTGDYDRGGVQRTGSLAEMLTTYLKLIDFEFYTRGDAAVICTFKEAGQRWLSWWIEHGGKLSYKNGVFVLSAR